ncbi:DNA-binding NarL/FixJ family response regulator [Sphingomonas zeicaulis]|uniref:response regulator transcription factor n=1 Tax=Sphingomonas zeicaulis TaxID=1632740 RepID=UPI003D24E59B
MNAGAWGYISSKTPFSSLRAQIELVALGDKVFPAELIGALAATRSIDTENGLVSALTEHERQVLSGMGYGLPTKDIATSTGITETRVKPVTQALCRKLRVKNRTQAALMAREHGWLSAQDDVAARFEAREAQKAAPSAIGWGAA